MEKKKQMEKNIILLVSFLLTTGVVMQSREMKDRYIYTSVQSVKEMEETIRLETEELNRLTEFKIAKERELEEYEKNFREGNVTKGLEEILQKKKLEAGYVDLIGMGVQVELRDSEKELKEGQDPNDLLIHDQDVLMLINDLKVAGAEAISVNGQRVLATTEIKCTGATIMINDITFGQPFIIKAIGEPVELEAAILAPSTYGSILRDLYHLQIKVEQKEVRISGI